MLYLLAIIFPPAVFFIADKPGSGIMNGLVWITCCGAPFASAWGIFEVAQYLQDERTKQVVDAIRETGDSRGGSQSRRKRRD